MDKNAKDVEDFEAILKIRGDRKPLALYDTLDLKSCSSSNTLKPQDVIAAVSRQLRDIQKADCLSKERKSAAGHQKSEFIPINLLSTQQAYHQQHSNKFETQCVSDTQLIDVADRIEAMVDNRGITQEFETTFCNKSTEEENLVNVGCIGEKISDRNSDKDVTEFNKNNFIEIKKTKEKFIEHNEENIFLHLDEINTEVCREFDTSYCRIEINNKQSQIQFQIDKQKDIKNDISFDGNVNNISGTCMCESNLTVLNSKDHSHSFSCSSCKHTQNIQKNMTTDLNINCKEADTENIEQQKNFMQYSEEGITEIDAEKTTIYEEKELPCSPVFKYFNTRRKSPSPLVCTLDSFEKFESLAMPLIDENLDFETAKRLINSQIMNMELVIGSNNMPKLGNPKEDLVSDINHSSSSMNKIELLEKSHSKEGNVNTFQEPKLENKQNIVDEIIFSSDEENDYLHCAVEDLPMTCALKKSFDESEVLELDQTMFVGFQTASNECIQVYKNSFEKAKSIFQNVCLQKSENLSVTELVDLYDGRTLPLSTKSDDAIICQANEWKENIVLPKSKCVSEFVGFETANGRSINISEKALQSAKNIFKDIGDGSDLFADDATYSEVVTAKKREATRSETESNKRIKLSEDSLLKTSNRFKDSDFSLNCQHNNHTQDAKHSGKIHVSSKNENIDQGDQLNTVDQILLQEFENESLEETSKDNHNSSKSFVRFKTASNKNIKISENALQRSMNIFKDIDSEADIKVNFDPGIGKKSENENDVQNLSKTLKFPSFKTANNKEIKVSEGVYSKIKDIFQDIEFEDISNKNFNINFVKNEVKRENTDVNENIFRLNKRSITETTKLNDIRAKLSVISKAKTSFNPKDESSNVYCNITTKDPYPVISGTKQNISTTNTSKNYCNTDNFVIKSSKYEPCDKNNSSSIFQDFKTASNKPVKICEEALLRSKNIFIFQDIDKNNTFKDNLKSNEGLTSDNSSLLNFNLKNQVPTSFGGFKTASKKPVKISEEALAKTKTVFQDIDISGTSEKPDPISSHYLGENTKFSQVLTSNAKTNNLQDNCNFLQCFQGFKTASNRSIQVSEDALLKSKNIFKDLEKYDEKDKQPENMSTENVFQGFKTAGNKPVPISEEALVATKNIFQDINCDSNINHNVLQTSVNTVNTALNTCIKSNNYVDVRNVAFKGFATASNKKVKVSEESLAKTKVIFKDFNLCDGSDDQETSGPEIGCVKTSEVETEIHKENNEAFEGFKGFQTASNKCLKVSEKALAKSRELFDDLNLDLQNNEHFISEGLLTSMKPNLVKKLTRPTLENPTSPNFGFQTEINISDANIEVSQENNKAFEGFKGFQTASKKCVKVSEEALAKSRKLFDDLNLDLQNNKELISGDLFIKMKPNLEKENVRRGVENAIPPSFGLKIAPNNSDDKTEIRKENNNACESFKGFQTASNKCVKVSDEAMAKSRKLFDDLTLDFKNNEDLLRKVLYTDDKPNLNKEDFNLGNENASFGFKTATNKSIKISEDALKKSRKLFADIDKIEKKENVRTQKTPKSDFKNNSINIDNILNTQVINNFEETLLSEDIQKNPEVSPKQCKRSGSPILSCPRAKKRKKFETPYRTNSPKITTPKNVCKIERSADFKYAFCGNYKKAKLYTLKDIDSINEKDKSALVDPDILNFDYDSLLNFVFEGSRNDLTDFRWTTDDLKKCFMESVNKKIIPDGWLDNHLKLILWKLISYEIRFPNAMKGVCSVKNVLEQLKYRYDKELYNVERPALRRLLEKDDVSTRTMILAVVGIYADGVKVESIINPSSTIELLLTDGWYCVKATVDAMITGLVCEGKIAVGRKIATVGAELVGCEQGISPWEDTSTVRLKIFGNSTRPALWDARLGYHSRGAIVTHVSAIKLSGGKASKTRLFVARVCPALYVQRFQDGSTVTRSERLENLHQMKYETERQLQLEKLYEEVEKEFYEQESSGSEDTDLKRSLQSGSQLHKKMNKSRDPIEFQSHLTESQTALLQDFTSRKKEKLLEELQNRVQDKVQKHGLNVGRNVIPLLKLRVAGVEERGENVVVTKAMISIWRPSDAVLEVVKEGTWIDVFNVVPTAMRNSELQLSAGRQSVFQRSKFKENNKMKPFIESLRRKCYTTKELNQNPTMTTDYNEIDTIGIVFQIEPSTKEFETSKSQFQNVYLTDLDKNFICVNFWDGLKKFGYENIFEISSVIVCMNLQKRAGNTRKSIPQYRATEFSVFTKTPKLENSRKMADDLVKQFSGLDKRKFCNDCISIKNNYATIRQTENISPYRFNTSDYNITKNKIFIDSPLAQRNDINFNLTGLDFESTFKQADSQELSPARLKQKQRVNEKIAKLKMYGEPPPLSNMYIINKSKNAGSAYKSPLTTNTSNVARLKNDSDSPVTTIRNNRINVQASPILSMNRTFVIRSGVNPVKLNFSSTSDGDEKDKNDPFEEEFDCSPPLSLDCNEL